MAENYITYVSAIVAILSFILQVRDSFPHYREETKAVLFISVGVFMGTLLGALNSMSISIDTEYGLLQIIAIIMLVVLFAAILSFIYIAIKTEDPNKRGEMYGVTTIAVFIFFVLFFATALSTSPNIEAKAKYSADELVALAKHHFAENNYDRALELYKKAQYEFRVDDPRRKAIEKNIFKITEAIASKYAE